MVTALTLIHVLNSLLLIVVVLLQSSKGGGLAGAFGGGGGTDAVFGGRGAGTFLSKATTVLAVIFMLTSLSLTVLGRRGGGEERDSVLRRALQQEGRSAVPTAGLPQAPATAPSGGEGAEGAPAAAEEGAGAPPAAEGTGQEQ